MHQRNHIKCPRRIDRRKSSIVLLASAPNHELYNEWEVSFISTRDSQNHYSKTTCKSKTWGPIHVQGQENIKKSNLLTNFIYNAHTGACAMNILSNNSSTKTNRFVFAINANLQPSKIDFLRLGALFWETCHTCGLKLGQNRFLCNKCPTSSPNSKVRRLGCLNSSHVWACLTITSINS